MQIPSIHKVIVTSASNHIFGDQFFDVSNMRSLTMQVSGDFSGVISVMVSNAPKESDAEYTTVLTITSPGVYSLPIGYRIMKVPCLSMSSGSPSVSIVFSQDDAIFDSSDVGDAALVTLIDQSGSGAMYIGKALRGTGTAAAGWRIKKIMEVGTVTYITWAGTAYDQIWDNRESLTYN